MKPSQYVKTRARAVTIRMPRPPRKKSNSTLMWVAGAAAVGAAVYFKDDIQKLFKKAE